MKTHVGNENETGNKQQKDCSEKCYLFADMTCCHASVCAGPSTTRSFGNDPCPPIDQLRVHRMQRCLEHAGMRLAQALQSLPLATVLCPWH